MKNTQKITFNILFVLLLIAAIIQPLHGQKTVTKLLRSEAVKSGSAQSESNLIFEDSMKDGWMKNWFLDGEKAAIEHRDGGLFFSGGTVTKSEDPENYHAHHAVLWTKQVFEGDLRISYEMTRVDSSDYGTTLLYIQAQGVGNETYKQDIAEWSDRRKIPAMNLYFENMDLISISFRENLRCKRYPWKDKKGEWFPKRGLIEPMVDYAGIIPGKTYSVEVLKRKTLVSLRLYDGKTKELLTDFTWDITKVPEELAIIQKGRIGLRHMSTRQFIYRNFKVEKL